MHFLPSYENGDEHHVRAAQGVFDTRPRFLGQLATDSRFHTGAQAGLADLDEVVGLRLFQGLCIGVCGNEFHAGHAFVDHVLHRIAASAADADNLDHRTLGGIFEHIDSQLLDITLCHA
jgi:hypothetical protein